MSQDEQDDIAVKLYRAGLLRLNALLEYAGWPSERAGTLLLRALELRRR